jgi:excisionase family DNA binding protein
MDNLAQNYQPSIPASIEGLDQIFVEVAEDQADGQHVDGPPALSEGQAVSVLEAAETLNITRRSVLRLIHEGKLDGAKDGQGQWLIKTSSIEKRLSGKNPVLLDLTPFDSSLDLVQDLAGPSLAEGQAEGQDEGHATTQSSIQDLMMRELLAKMEALTYRNGYLEAQLENQREQIKLLTDSQHKPGFWSKFAHWFKGAP